MDIQLRGDKKTIIISIENKDLEKLARVVYDICLDNKIGATIINDKKMTKKKEEPKELSKNKKENKNLSEELLSSYRSALFKVKNYFDELEFSKDTDADKAAKQAKTIVDIGAGLGKAMETLAVLEKKVASDEGINSKVRGAADVGLFEEK